MNRRLFLSLIASPAFAALAHSLHAGSASATTEPPATTDDPASTTGLSAAINAFAAELHAAVVTDQTVNVVHSPMSIAMALAMAISGARGETATEMNTVLHTAGIDDLASATKHLRDNMAEVSGRESTLSLANSLWVQQGMSIVDAYRTAMTTDYGAALYDTDFASDPEAARLAINAWVDEQTQHRLPELLAPGVIEALTRLVLVNAIHFQASWSVPFAKELTTPGTFRRHGAEPVTVPMMHRSDTLRYAAIDGWRAIELDYTSTPLAMLIGLPDDATSTELIPASVAGALDRTLVNLSVPRFDTGSTFELGDVLGALGMHSAFTADADFSGISASEHLQIGAVVHQANITVDEYGTEAAAATAVALSGSAANAEPPQPVDFVVDRPFTFVIHDRRDRTIVFAGRIANPAARRS